MLNNIIFYWTRNCHGFMLYNSHIANCVLISVQHISRAALEILATGFQTTPYNIISSKKRLGNFITHVVM